MVHVKQTGKRIVLTVHVKSVGGGGAHKTRRKKTAKRRKKSGGRALKFGSPAWRKKYMPKKRGKAKR